MKLRKVIIKNFRCLRDITVPISDATVLVGENNSGKTAFLEALGIAIPWRIPGRGNPFKEYDYHMVKNTDSPQSSEGIIIELWFCEDKADEWPDSLIQSLSEIIQTDPILDLDSLGLRLWSKYDEISKEIVTKWEFLALNGQPLGGKAASPGNLTKFLQYIRCFYLSSLRDSGNEFSPRSQFWGRILRDLKIDEKQKKLLTEELEKLNESLLKGDPRLEKVRATLEEGQKIMEMEAGQKTSIQALPLKPWDLMSKAEVVIKPRGSELDFPLSCHGQGMQSLSVIFLFQAYIDVLLKPTFRPETEALLTLEEPEAHLHPQTSRALAANLSAVKSQKIVSSHSPYFIQEIPFKQIRMFRRDGPFSKVLYMKSSFTTKIPKSTDLQNYCENNKPKFNYNEGNSILTVSGVIEESEYRNLLTFYPGQTDVHAQLKNLRDESLLFLNDNELADLETYVKRMRGEILFARAWLLCEGQSEYLLLRFFSNLMGKSLDQAGVAVIDYQNNGSPGAFVSLARVFEIPWIMFCDNDEGGKSAIKELKKKGITDNKLVRPFPEDNMDLEKFLVNNGFRKEFIQIFKDNNISLKKNEGERDFEDELISELRSDKIGYTNALIKKLQEIGADESRIPDFFKYIVNDVISQAI